MNNIIFRLLMDHVEHATDLLQSPNLVGDPCPDLSLAKLFVGGLSWQTCEEKLREYFQQFGKVEDVLIMKDPSTQVNFFNLHSERKYKKIERKSCQLLSHDPHNHKDLHYFGPHGFISHKERLLRKRHLTIWNYNQALEEGKAQLRCEFWEYRWFFKINFLTIDRQECLLKWFNMSHAVIINIGSLGGLGVF